MMSERASFASLPLEAIDQIVAYVSENDDEDD
jgi:hypothetical protein